MMRLEVDDEIAGLEQNRRRKIEDRAAELIAEEMTLDGSAKAGELPVPRYRVARGLKRSGGVGMSVEQRGESQSPRMPFQAYRRRAAAIVCEAKEERTGVLTRFQSFSFPKALALASMPEQCSIRRSKGSSASSSMPSASILP